MKATNDSLKIYALIAFFLLTLIPQISAQTTYAGQTAYGGNKDDFTESLEPTLDGGYIMAGYSLSYDNNYSPHLTKFDSLGGIVWSNTYGTGYGFAYDAKATTDGGYIFAGYLDEFGSYYRDYYLVKTDANGDTTWTRAFGETTADFAYSVIQTTDGGYLMGGKSAGSGNDILLVKTDAAGDTIWTKRYNSGSEYCEDIIQTSDGGYAITGQMAGGMLLMKINSTGDVDFTRKYSGPSLGSSLVETSDGGFIVVGETTNFGAGASDMLVLRTDTDGVVIWARTFGGVGNEHAYSITKAGLASYLIVGETSSFGAGGVDGYAVQVDLFGSVEWSKTYGNIGNDYLKGGFVGNDNGLVFGGYTTSNGAGMKDFHLLRADQYGNIQCDQGGAATLVSSPTVVESSPSVTTTSGTGVRSTTMGEGAIALGVDTACAFTAVDLTVYENKYQRVFGGLSDDECNSVDRTVDGGYIFAGKTQSFGAGVDDVFLVKTDENANIEWSQAYGGTSNDEALAVIQTIDGGYAIAGKTQSFGAGNYDGYLIKTNSSGAVAWDKTYGTTSSDQIDAIIELADGSFVLAGSSNDNVLLIKTNSSGDTLWTRTFDAGGVDKGYGLSQAPDGGFVLAGKTDGQGAGGYDVLVIKTDANGDQVAAFTYGGAQGDHAASIIPTGDGGFLVGGDSRSYVIPSFTGDLFMLKLDNNGLQQWAQTYGGSGYAGGGYVAMGTDNSYTLLGKTTGFSSYPSDIYLINADTSGTMNWSKLYGYILDPDNKDKDNGYGIVQQTADGGYMIAGSSESFGAGDFDFYAVKTDKDGVSGGCFERDPATLEQSVTFTGAVAVLTQSAGMSTGSATTLSAVATSSSKKLNIETSVIVTNVSCNAGNDGLGDLSISGGSGPYDFNWSSGSTNEDLSSSIAGWFAVTVTDVYGCTVSDSAIITEPSILSSTISGTNITCNGGNDGTTTITPAGGTTPYNVVWNNGQITATAVGLYAGTYTVSIVDANGCPGTNIITITEPNVLGTSISNTAVTCFSGSDGTASVAAVDGTGPYTYLWSNAATSSGITGVVAGTYYVTSTDNCGKSNTDSTVISEPAELTVSGNKVDITCFGLDDGTAEIIAANGTPPYTYLWSTLATSSAISGLSAGTFFVTVTDACSDTKNGNVTIAEPVVLTTSMSKTNVTCNGGGDGTATATPAGGTSPYTYLWSVGQITSTAVALFPGIYSVNIFDANGCLTSNGVSISQPAAMAGAVTSDSTTCNGGSDGSADLTVTGGTLPYTYLWSSAETTEDISGKIAGTYTVTVTDACTATINGSIAIDEPAIMSTSVTGQNVSCNGNSDGTADLTTSDGTPPYTYLWSTTETTEDISGLIAATYSVTVSDACLGSTFDMVVITEPLSLTSIISKTDVTCNGGGDGTATVTASGGTPPYNYLWNNGQGTSTAIGLFPGNYSVNITDVNGCLTSNLISVSEPVALSGVTSVTDVTCNSGADGQASIIASGGTLPYTYLWDDPGTQTNAAATSLTAGTYLVIVTDGCGGSYSQSLTVSEPTALTGILVGTDVSCNGAGDGSVDLSPTGGTIPYIFAWSSLDTTEDLSSKGPDTYVVTITDACAATYEDSLILLEPAVLATSMSSTDVSCYSGGNGTATVVVSGGIGPYNYLWNNSQSNPTAIGLFPGSYSVNVTDANGCLTSDLVTITEPNELSINLSSTDVNCSVGNDGTATANASFGTPPYMYLWMPGGDSNMTAVNLAEDTYTVVVTDSCGATKTDSVVVNGPGTLNLTIAAADISCNGFNDGMIDATVSSGSPPYTFLWSTGDSTEDLSGLSQGMYVLTITDSCNTVKVDSVFISEPGILTSTMTSTDISCFGMGDGTATAAPSGGISPYLYTWNNGQFAATAVGLYAGNYSVNILDDNGCLTTNLVTINEPADLGVQVDIVDATCGNSDGSADANVSGGTGIYTYLWSTGGTSSSEPALADGAYSLLVTDENGCTVSESVSVITESLAQQICIITVNETSSKNIVVWENPQTSNIASYNIYREIPGTGYTLVGNMLWSETSEFTDSASGIDPSITSYRYKISAVDTCGNESVWSDYHETMHLALPILSGGKVSLVWDNYEGFNFSYYRILRDTTGLGDTNWVAIDSVTASNTSYTDINPPTGSAYYAIEVVVVSICTSDKSKSYNSSKSNTTEFKGSSNQLSATTSSTETTFGICDGTATVTATGGTPPMTYQWDGNASNQTTTTATSLCPGTYSVVVTDSLGNEVVVFATVGTLPGMDEQSVEIGLQLYPNPNTGVFEVEWSSALEAERLLVYNTLGQLVYFTDEQMAVNKRSIDLASQAPGLYYLQVDIGGQSLYKKVIIE